MAIPITGSPQAVPLGNGYALRAPGLQGTAEVVPATVGLARSIRSGGGGLLALEMALRATDTTPTRDIEVDLRPVPGAAAPPLRSAHGEPGLELEVPDPGPEYGQLVLSIDDSGGIRWHLPEPADASLAAASGTRGAGAVRRFRIPAALPPPPAGAIGLQQRSLIGAIGKRVLKVLVYPFSDALLGYAVDSFARHWEAQKRPHRLRRFSPADYTTGAAPGLAPAELAGMSAAGPVLLFVHGTFSTAHGAFGDLPLPALTQLDERYGGRVIAFDHPTLADDPKANVQWLLQQVPAGMQADIVCHSRGGLVSRLLVERPASFGLPVTPIHVRRVVLAGVPNAGTALADKDHMVDMIDRLTTVLTLFPSGPAAETLEAVITAVKMLGRGVLTGLDGLVAMQPKGGFVRDLNIPGSAAGADYYAIASDYEPTDRGLRALVSGAADNLLDFVFENSSNDLVVPTDGVHARNGHASFPIAGQRVHLLARSEGAMHTGLFAQASVQAKLLEWLRVEA